jgi:hypothetical protein
LPRIGLNILVVVANNIIETANSINVDTAGIFSTFLGATLDRNAYPVALLTKKGVLKAVFDTVVSKGKVKPKISGAYPLKLLGLPRVVLISMTSLPRVAAVEY